MATKKTAEAEVVLTLSDRITAGLNKIQARIGALSSRLGIGRISGEIGNVGRSVANLGPALTASTQRLGLFTAAIGAGGGGAVAAAVSLAGRAAEAGAEITRLSQLSGMGAEEFQRYAYAAGTVGIEGDKLSDIFKDMQDRVGDFIQTGGGPMADFFENIAPRVGLTAENFRDLNGADALQLYVSSLQRANLSQSEMIFYLEAMASDSSLLLPLLRDNGAEMSRLGDEAERTGNIMSAQAAAFGREYQENTRYLQSQLGGLVTLMGVELLPVMNEVVEEISAWMDANQGLMISEIQAWVGRFADLLRDLMDPASEIRVAIDQMVDSVTEFYRAITPVIDFLGGPGMTALYGVGLYIGGPLIAALASLTGSVFSLGAAILTTPLGWILGGIALLAGSAYVFIQKWDEFVAYWGGLWGRITDAFDQSFTHGILTVLREFNPLYHVMVGMNAVLEYFTGIDLFEVGEAIVQSLFDGFQAMWGEFSSWASTKASEIGASIAASMDPRNWFSWGGGEEAPAPGMPSVGAPAAPTLNPDLPVVEPGWRWPWDGPAPGGQGAADGQVTTETVEAGTVQATEFIVPEPILTSHAQTVNANLTTGPITINGSGLSETQMQNAISGALRQASQNHQADTLSNLND